MKTVDHSLQLILENIPIFSKIQELPVSQCENRILAETILAPCDFPKTDNSSMDGFVFLKSDLKSGLKSFPIQFEVRPETKKIPALKKKYCARILTGGTVPQGDVIIVPVEQTLMEENKIVLKDIPTKDLVRKKGSGYKKGDELLIAKTLLRPYEKGMLISAGVKRVKVLKEISVCIQNTGNEIKTENNTNGPVLFDLLTKIPGLKVKLMPIVGDNAHVLKKRFQSLLSNFEVVVTTGGISAGTYDYVHSVLENLGVNFFIRKISQKPGKPVTIGLFKNRPVCCLPGNPMSAVFCTEFYLRVLIYKMLGFSFKFISAFAQNEIENKSSLTAFHTGKMYVEEGMVKVKINTGIQSNLLTLYRDSNCYIMVKEGATIKVGNKVKLVPFMYE